MYHEGINEDLINTRNKDRAPVHNNVEGFNQEFVNNCLQKNSGTSNLVKSWIGGTSNPFSIDYSKCGTAKCQKCKKNIGQDELRIGKSLPFKGKFISRYFHVPSAFAMFRKARVATCTVTHRSRWF